MLKNLLFTMLKKFYYVKNVFFKKLTIYNTKKFYYVKNVF